jgi:hypothetical protein
VIVLRFAIAKMLHAGVKAEGMGFGIFGISLLHDHDDDT